MRQERGIGDFVGKRNSAAVHFFGKHSQDCVLARRFTFFCDASLDPCKRHTKRPTGSSAMYCTYRYTLVLADILCTVFILNNGT